MTQRIVEFVSNGSGLFVVFVLLLGGVVLSLGRRSGKRALGKVASLGTSALALLGVNQCNPPDPTPTPGPTCYEPMYITPTPEVVTPVAATPKDMPTPTCYAPPYEPKQGSATDPLSILAGLDQRLTSLEELYAAERLQPDVIEKTLALIESEIESMRAAGTLTTDQEDRAGTIAAGLEQRVEALRVKVTR